MSTRNLTSWVRVAGLLALLAMPQLWADEPVGRSKAAAIALAAFGGKVLSVDEAENEAASSEPEEPQAGPEVRYVVKLLQDGGRVKVVRLDAAGKIL